MKKASLLSFAGLLLAFLLTIFTFRRSAQVSESVAQAQAPAPDVKQLVIPAGQKLKDANWHCYAGGGCELWYLTKPRKGEDKPESYVFSNADGTRKYVIKEQ